MNEKRASICGKIKMFKAINIHTKEPFMSIVNTFTFESNKQINFDGGDLSSDADFLLIKAFVNKRLLNYLFHI